MKIIKDTFNYEQNFPEAFSYYFKGLKFATFDIETTGLSPKTSKLILSGFAIYEEDSEYVNIYQFFSEGDDEEEIIKESLHMLSKLDFIITYNGASFDVPFFTERAKALGFDNISMPYNLDLYKLIKTFSDIKSFLPNLKQKTIENFLGIWQNRADEIDGGESIILFTEYLTTKDINLENKILLHNSDDIKQLYRLIKIIEKIDFHKAMTKLGFPVFDMLVSKIDFSKQNKVINIKGEQSFINYSDLGNFSNFTFSFAVPNFEIKSKIIEHLGLYFVNIKDNKLDYDILNDSTFVKGDFLILARDDKINYKAVNTYTKAILKKALDKRNHI